MLKDVLGPIVVIVVAMVIGAATSVFIAVQIAQEEMKQVRITLSNQNKVNEGILDTIRSLELSNARQQERNATEAVLLERLQQSTEDRYTGKDAGRELAPVHVRIDANTRAISEIKVRLNLYERGTRNDNYN